MSSIAVSAGIVVTTAACAFVVASYVTTIVRPLAQRPGRRVANAHHATRVLAPPPDGATALRWGPTAKPATTRAAHTLGVPVGDHADPFKDWRKRSEAGKLLYTEDASLPLALMPNLGNGYMASQFGNRWLFVSGVFNGKGSKSHRAHIPHPFADVAPLGAAQLRGTALDFEDGAVEQIFTWPHALAVQRTYYHQALQHILVTELEVDNRGGNSALIFQLSDQFASRLEPLLKSSDSADVQLHNADLGSGQRYDGIISCVNGSTKSPEADSVELVGIALCRTNPADSYSVPAGGSARIQLLASLWTTLDPRPANASSPLQAAVAESIALHQRSLARVYGEHRSAMRNLWKGSIEVDGNAELARNVRSSWWNLLLSYRLGQNMSSSPGGLANDCYNGHSFWDVEQFMWPNLLLFQPQLAAGALQYRYDRRQAATANAAVHDNAGMQFPWESAITGQEVSPWHLGAHEIHINGDVSLAFWQYWQATGDKQWLEAVGWPVLSGIASFWASRAALTPNSHRSFEISNVVDVDETAQHVTNSSYTNAVAKLALQNAAKTAQIIGKDAHPSWLEVAEGLSIPFDPADMRHPEYETAKAGSGLGVILMQYPLAVPAEWGMNEKVRASDLTFYEHQKKVANAMYWWAFAIGWLGLGKPEAAKEYFHRSTVRNVFGPFHIWTEQPNGEGCSNFVTGAGAYLQILWAGYGGLRLTDDSMIFHQPQVPPNSTGLSFRSLAYRGGALDVRITEGSVSFQLVTTPPGEGVALRAVHRPSDRSVTLRLKGDPAVFPSKGTVTVTLENGVRGQ